MKAESLNGALPDRCYIFGAGSFGKSLVEVLNNYNVEVVGILDNKATGSWSGLEIQNPANADNSIHVSASILFCMPGRKINRKDLDPNEIN